MSQGWLTRARRDAPTWLTVFAVASTASLLAGCAPLSAPAPSPSPVKSHPAGPIQTLTKPPTGKRVAVAAANAAVRADDTAFFDVFEGTLPGSALQRYETGAWLKYTTQFVNQIGDESGVGQAYGHPDVWLPQKSRTTATTLARHGMLYPFAIVQMAGCFRTGWNFLNASPGAAPEPIEPQITPYDVTVEYQPSKRLWLVSNEVDVTGEKYAPVCSANS